MNFNHQPTMNMNDQASQTFHPSVGTGYFAEQPLLRNGYPASSYTRRFSGYFPNPIDSSGAIQREIEKERIREGIILAEIARRRMFDEEFLRELRLGRNLVGGFLSSSSIMSNHGSIPSEPSSLEERLISSVEKRSEFPIPVPVRRFEGSNSESMQMFQRSSQHRVSTVNHLLEGANEGKPKSMYKPQVNLFGLKRKADSSLLIGDDDEPTSSTSSKKTSFKKESKFCSLCQVGATSKENLNDHLEEKKHKASVLRLKQKHEKKNYEIGLSPKKNYEIGLFPKKNCEIGLSPKNNCEIGLSPKKNYEIGLFPKNYEIGLSPKKNYEVGLSPKKNYEIGLFPKKNYEIGLSPKKNYEIGLFPKNYEIGLFPKTGMEKQERNPDYVFVGEEAVVRMKNDLPLFRSKVPFQSRKRMIHKRGKKNHLRKSSTTSRKKR